MPSNPSRFRPDDRLDRLDRRGFLRSTAAAATAAATGAALAAGARGARGEALDPASPLKVGLVGAGGRGTGAAKQALTADDQARLHAVAEIFPEATEQSLGILSSDPELRDRIDVPPERRFLGFDAYRRVLESGVDVVLLATPPGFRPLHMRAAVEAGVHIFAEKPMAVDAAGSRHAMETVAMAKTRPISLVAGFCFRFAESLRQAYRVAIEEAAIGRLTGIYSTRYAPPTKPHLPATERPDGMGDVEWQLRNWYNYTWTSGGGYVSQAVHSVDKVSWAMGDVPPLSCRATGGLAVPVHGGNIYDHYHVAYEYPGGVWCHLASRKMAGCFNEHADYIQGTEGRLVLGRGRDPYIENLDGETVWRYRSPREGEPNMYQVEHDVLFQSIRSGEHVNDGDWMMLSTLMSVMGRISASTGQQVTWEEALAADEELCPGIADLSLDQDFDPGPLAVPGITRIPGVGVVR